MNVPFFPFQRYIRTWIRPLLLICCTALVLTGCLGAREINDMAIISGAAFDAGPEPDSYQVSAEIVNKNVNAAEGGSQSDKIQGVGGTVSDAIRNCGYTDSRTAYWSHAKVFIISRELAESRGIGPLLDYAARNYKARLSIDLMISGMNQADSVLELSTASTNIKAFDLEEMLKNDLHSSGAAPLKVYQAIDLLNTEGIEMTVPIVQGRPVSGSSGSTSKTAPEEGSKPSKSTDPGGTNSQETDFTQANNPGISSGSQASSEEATSGSMAYIAGTAAFRGDKMVGTLSRDETVSLLFLQDRMEQTELSLPAHQLSVAITNSKTKWIPSFSPEGITLVAQIKADASVTQMKGNPLSDPRQRERMSEEIGDAISSQCLQLIQRVQSQLKTDIFGFGRIINNTRPDLWQQVRERWNTDGFPKVNAAVRTEVHLNPGETTAGQTVPSSDESERNHCRTDGSFLR